MAGNRSFILGAGVTGLGAGWASGLPVYEATSHPGGICCSYYSRKDGKFLAQAPDDDEGYRFELGGGHWIFGGEPGVLRFIGSLTPLRSYQRRASVFLPRQNLLIPYPLQNHLRCLDHHLAIQALGEISDQAQAGPTLADWLHQTFGPTLTELFFGPFHELYTAGLWKRVSPQDGYKSPVNMAHVQAGVSRSTPPVGYNSSFLYPVHGLDALARQLASRADVHYGQRAARVDLDAKTVVFEDGVSRTYDTLISTLPLNKMMELSGSKVEEQPDPYTSVLVLNVGAVRGPRCPEDHWVYVPESDAGFFRVGFYSNVDPGFLPRSSRGNQDRVSLYVERAYAGGQRPTAQQVEEYSLAALQQLRDWGFIEHAEVVHPTWIDVAYTWTWPGSRWRAAALAHLQRHNVIMVGRYARWIFQGIADSIRDGLRVGATDLGMDHGEGDC